MSDSPTQLHPVTTTLNEHAIDLLKEWLKRAEDGEVLGVHISGMMSEGRHQSQFSGDISMCEMVFMLERAKHLLLDIEADILRECMEEEPES